MLWMTAAVNWLVVAKPPRSRVRTFPSLRTLLIEVWILAASCFNPMCSSIWAALKSMAVGLATFLPERIRIG